MLPPNPPLVTHLDAAGAHDHACLDNTRKEIRDGGPIEYAGGCVLHCLDDLAQPDALAAGGQPCQHEICARGPFEMGTRRCPGLLPDHGPRGPEAFLFPRHAQGRGECSFIVCWRMVCADAKLGGRRLHDLRRTAASQAVMAGENLALAVKLPGHRRRGTKAGYAHLDDVHVVEAAEKVGSLIAAAMESAQPRRCGDRATIGGDKTERTTAVIATKAPAPLASACTRLEVGS